MCSISAYWMNVQNSPRRPEWRRKKRFISAYESIYDDELRLRWCRWSHYSVDSARKQWMERRAMAVDINDSRGVSTKLWTIDASGCLHPGVCRRGFEYNFRFRWALAGYHQFSTRSALCTSENLAQVKVKLLRHWAQLPASHSCRTLCWLLGHTLSIDSVASTSAFKALHRFFFIMEIFAVLCLIASISSINAKAFPQSYSELAAGVKYAEQTYYNIDVKKPFLGHLKWFHNWKHISGTWSASIRQSSRHRQCQGGAWRLRLKNRFRVRWIPQKISSSFQCKLSLCRHMDDRSFIFQFTTQ